MKCPKCKGTGRVSRPDGTELFGLTELMTCDLCRGNGEVMLTNEEWFCSLSTEEKAIALNELYWTFDDKGKLYCDCEPTTDSYLEWLKAPHKE